MTSGLSPLIRKELTELRRDRRVLLLTLVLPVVLYPAVIGAMDRMQQQRESEIRQRTLIVAVNEGDPYFEDVLRGIDGIELRTMPADSVRARANRGEVALGLELPPRLMATGESVPDTLLLHGRFTREATREAQRRVESRLDRALGRERQARWESRGGEGSLALVLGTDSISVGSVSAESGAEASRLVVYLLLMTLFMASATLATDMVAGEKERGTLETLFLAPLDRSALAHSKLIVVSMGTATTGLLSLLSLMVSYRMGWIGQEGSRLVVDAPTVGAVALLLIPLAVLLGAVLLIVSAWARSLKEAQYYVLPVMLIVFVPALLSMSQAIELDPLVALLPIANVAFVMRDVLAQQISPAMLVLVLVSTVGWTVLAARVVTNILSREETVLGFDPEPLFARSSGGRRRAAHLGMMLSVLGYFYAGQWLQAQDLLWGLAASLWVVLPLLGVGVAALVRPVDRDWRGRLSLRGASPLALLGSVLLAWGALLPIVGGLGQLQSIVLPMSQNQVELFSGAFEGMSLWVLFVLAALSPAICEELVFRGMFLGLLREQGGARQAVVLSALWFSLVHLSIYRLLPTFLLGVVLALLVLRHRSLLPAMVMHLFYNGSLLLGGRWVEENGTPIDLDGPVAWTASVALLIVGALMTGLAPRLRRGRARATM